MPDDRSEYEVQFPGLPLATYREIAAHLRQVEGVEVSLKPQTSREFDYNRSQIAGLQIHYDRSASLASRERAAQILTYYQKLYSG
jgi:hypothetical protein